MKRGTQTQLAAKAGITQAFISMILSNKRRPSWNMAKKLAVVTKTKPELWLEGNSETIKIVLDSLNF